MPSTARLITATLQFHLLSVLLAAADCGPCSLNNLEMPRLFINEPLDGAGARLMAIVYGMALAAEHQMNFGGVVSNKKYLGGQRFSHGVDIQKTAEAFFGLNSSEHLFIDSPPMFHATYRSVEEFLRAARVSPGLGKRTNVLVKGLSTMRMVRKVTMRVYLTEPFLAALKRSAIFLTEEHLDFKHDKPSVALHVRRGDMVNMTPHIPKWLNDTEVAQRWRDFNETHLTSDEWYYRIVELIREHLPTADVHVWSESGGNPTLFDGFRSRNMTVHLDGGVLSPWAHFAQADIFVMDRSGFSQLPALLNDNCVIYLDLYEPLTSWIIDSNKGIGEPKVDNHAISACLAGIRKFKEQQFGSVHEL